MKNLRSFLKIFIAVTMLLYTSVALAEQKNPSAPSGAASAKGAVSASPATAAKKEIQPIPLKPAQPLAPLPANAPSPALAPASVPSLNPSDTYSYSPLGKPDPFLPFVEVELAKQKKKKEESKKKAALSIFPLQRAETELYQVVGIMGDEDHRMAIVQDASRKFYPLMIGTRIGLNDGKVVEILPDRVIVEEYENDKPKKVILKLRKN